MKSIFFLLFLSLFNRLMSHSRNRKLNDRKKIKINQHVNPLAQRVRRSSKTHAAYSLQQYINLRDISVFNVQVRQGQKN